MLLQNLFPGSKKAQNQPNGQQLHMSSPQESSSLRGIEALALSTLNFVYGE
jgi:hypothetical protein